MLTFGFDKSRAEYFIECLENGKRIDPRTDTGPTGKWTRHDLLQLAGACMFMYLQGQRSGLMNAIASGAWDGTHGEYKEAISQTAIQDVEDAARLCSELTADMELGTYDKQYKPVQWFQVSKDNDGGTQVTPVEGPNV